MFTRGGVRWVECWGGVAGLVRGGAQIRRDSDSGPGMGSPLRPATSALPARPMQLQRRSADRRIRGLRARHSSGPGAAPWPLAAEITAGRISWGAGWRDRVCAGRSKSWTRGPGSPGRAATSNLQCRCHESLPVSHEGAARAASTVSVTTRWRSGSRPGLQVTVSRRA